MSIDWSKAPKGANFFQAGKYYKYVNQTLFAYGPKEAVHTTNGVVDTWSACDAPTARKVTYKRPEYHSGVPTVGMEVDVTDPAGSSCVCATILYVGEQVLCFSAPDGEEYATTILGATFAKPDRRTDEQKLCDAACKVVGKDVDDVTVEKLIAAGYRIPPEQMGNGASLDLLVENIDAVIMHNHQSVRIAQMLYNAGFRRDL